MKSIKESRLIDLLSRLNKKEINELSLFISSPFFNTNQTVIKFFRVLKNEFPFNKEINLQKTVLYKKTFGRIEFNDQRLRDIMSLTLGLAEKFIAVNQIFNSGKYDQFLAVAGYNNELVSAYFEKEIIKNLKTAATTFYDTERRITQFHLLQCAPSLMEPDLSDKNSESIVSIEEAATQSQISQIIFSIRHYLNLSSINQFLQYERPVTENLASSIIFQLETFELKDQHSLFWKNLFLFRYEKKFHYLEEIKKHIESGHYLELPFKDFTTLTSTLSNTLLYFTEETYNHKARIELAYLYKRFALDGKYKYKELNPVLFSGIVATNIFVGDTDWLKEFILSHESFLPEQLRASTFSYNMAHLLFVKKQFKEAIQQLNKTEYDDEFRQIAVYNLLLKIYFEKGDLFALEDLSDTYRHFLKRAKLINEKRKTNHRNFIRYSIQLFHIISEKSDLQLKEFNRELQSEEKIVDKKWLSQKATL